MKNLASSAVTCLSMGLLAILAVPTLLLVGLMGLIWDWSDKLTGKLK